MMFEDFQAFLDMGGHGLYVWLVYGSAVPLLIFNFVKMRRARLKLLQDLKAAGYGDATQST